MSIFSAMVVSGHGRGKIFGFPTLNLNPDAFFSVAPGVYAVKVSLFHSSGLNAESEHRICNAVMHVGPRPTFDEIDVSIEVHLLNVDSNVQVERVEVEVLGRLRDVMAFSSADALKAQIEKDIQAAGRYTSGLLDISPSIL